MRWWKCLLKISARKKESTIICWRYLQLYDNVLIFFRYIALKVSLLPEMNDDLEVFHTATAIWLMQVYLNDEPTKENGKVNYAPKELKKISFPLPDNVPDTVRYEIDVQKLIFLGLCRNKIFSLFD